jgi:hypothetical protein
MASSGCTLVAQTAPNCPPTWPGLWMPGRSCPSTSAVPSSPWPKGAREAGVGTGRLSPRRGRRPWLDASFDSVRRPSPSPHGTGPTGPRANSSPKKTGKPAGGLSVCTGQTGSRSGPRRPGLAFHPRRWATAIPLAPGTAFANRPLIRRSAEKGKARQGEGAAARGLTCPHSLTEKDMMNFTPAARYATRYWLPWRR